MRRLLVPLAAAVLLLTSCAATFTVRGNAPGADNDGSCGAPVLTPRLSTQTMWVQLSVVGPVTWRDSVQVTTAGAFAFTRAVPAGSYLCRVWALDSGGVGCDTTFTREVRSTPWTPTVR